MKRRWWVVNPTESGVELLECTPMYPHWWEIRYEDGKTEQVRETWDILFETRHQAWQYIFETRFANYTDSMRVAVENIAIAAIALQELQRDD